VNINPIIASILIQCLLFFLLLKQDVNDGEKELFRKQNWKMSDVCIILILINILPIALSMFFRSTLGAYLNDVHAFSDQEQQSMFASLFLLSLIATFRLKFKQSFSILGIKREELLKNVCLGLIVPIVFIATLYLVKVFVTPQIEAFSFGKKIFLSACENRVDCGLFFINTMFFAPLIEEPVFRGILYSPYRKKYGPILATLFTAAIFSVVHLSGYIEQFFNGILFAVLYEKTESLITVLIAHSVFSLSITLLVIWGVK
jgi:uncharacterized protein